MKRIIITKIKMKNFRGASNYECDFNVAKTCIAGKNGSGKSRHFDAFLWCLTGKDTKDRKDFEVKTRINGEELHDVETSVEVSLIVDNTEVRLKRAINEVYYVPKGSTERVFKGNETSCFINDVPLAVNAYNDRVNEIIDVTTFKMLTNPEFLLTQKPMVLREAIMQLVDVRNEKDVIASNDEFAVLQQAIAEKSLEDYAKEIAVAKRKLKKELDAIQPKVDQTIKLKPNVSYTLEQVEAELADVDAKIAEAMTKRADYSQVLKDNFNEQKKLQDKIQQLRLKQSEIIADAKEKAQAEAFELNAEIYKKQQELKIAKMESTDAVANEMLLRRKYADLVEECNRFKADKNRLLNEYRTTQMMKFEGETICPTCGQTLPIEKVEKAEAIFNEKKAQELKSICEHGSELRNRIDEMTTQIKAKSDEIEAAKLRITEADTKVKEIEKWIAEHKEVAPAPVQGIAIPDYIKINNEIKAINEQLSQLQADSGIQSNIEKMQGIAANLQYQQKQLNEKKALAQRAIECDKQVEELNVEGKNLAEQLAEIYNAESLIEKVNHIVMTEVEEKVNGLFESVKFQMYEFTIDGNPVPTCIALINGVRYQSANKASQINAGIEVIDKLCEHFDVYAPIFIDNAESIIEIKQPKYSQLITLLVADQDLTIY